MNKSDTIRQVLRELGPMASNRSVRDHLAKKGVVATSTLVGKVQRQLLAENGQPTGQALAPMAEARLDDGPPWDQEVAVPAKAGARPVALDVPQLIATVRELIAVLGSKDEVKRVVDAL
jgi:hypothetical protein